MNTTHKIVQLKVKNFKNLKAVEITPEGNIVTLTGPNGAGKSSVLDSMQAVLAGKDGSVARPIRDGANDADIEIDLGHGLRAVRRYTAGGSVLKVELAGDKQGSPQSILDALTGGILGFDPLEFTRLKPTVQRETFLKLVGLDFTAHDKDRQAVYTQRTEANREVDRLAARLSGMKPFDATVPAEPTSAAELVAKLEDARQIDAQHNSLRRKVEDTENALIGKGQEIAHAHAQIMAWQKVIAEKQVIEAQLQESLRLLRTTVLPAPVDQGAIQQQIQQVDTVNAAIRNNKELEALKRELHDATNAANALSDKLERADQHKADQIRNAKSPLPGLTFDDAGLLFNGLPLSEASTGHKIRVSVAIGMALNPKLRVIFVRDGSLLDSEGLKIIAEMSLAENYQVWIEDARSEDNAAIIIEDGQIKYENQTSDQGAQGESRIVGSDSGIAGSIRGNGNAAIPSGGSASPIDRTNFAG